MDGATRANRRAWDAAPSKYVREHAETRAAAASGSSLLDTERELLSDVPRASPCVAHLSGHLFVSEEHPAAPLWSWDADEPPIRADRSYFAARHVDDVFPGGGATRWQWSLGAVVTAVAEAGLQILRLGEHAEPFWRMGGVSAAAWMGRLPNSFALLARRTTVVVDHPPDDRDSSS